MSEEAFDVTDGMETEKESEMAAVCLLLENSKTDKLSVNTLFGPRG
jgi:hypothetical protein